MKRVGVLRALLVAHGQMTWNRTKRGLGRRGLFGLAVVVLFLVLGAVPLFGAFGFLGYLFGKNIDQPLVAPLLGTTLFVSALGFGVVGGLLGGARQLTWEAYRSFPVPFRALFFAETAASLGDLVVLGFVGVMTCLGVAFVWEAPLLAPLVALLVGELVLWVLFLQQLMGALAVGSVRRLRRAMVVVVVAAWSGVSVIAAAARELKGDVAADHVTHLQRLWERASPFVNALPTVHAVHAMALARQGAFARAALYEAPAFVVTLLLAAVSYALLRREESPRSAPDLGLPARQRPRTRRDGAHPPVYAIARLHLHHVAGSLQGRFGLVVPLITVVLVKGPLGAAGIGPALTLPGSVIYLALAATQLHFNQFGFDGHGVKTLLLLPVEMRDLLLGKGLALLAYAAAQNLFLLALLAYVLRPTPVEALAAGLLGACLAVAHAGEGHWISALYPRPLAMHRMNPGGLSGANLLPLGVGMLNAAFFGGVYALMRSWRPIATVPALVGLLAVMTTAYWVLLPRASSFVASRRENLVEVLG